MDLRIAGRRALVTGSSSGIGYAIARGAGARRRRRDSEWPRQEKLDAAVRRLQKAVDGAVCEAVVADASTAEGAQHRLALSSAVTPSRLATGRHRRLRSR
jgi:NAD(P)-dependent dehydrogenase (short-subunit alcohol dehydrogenase family)